MAMKYIVIIPDGMADYPVEELGNRTPLEVADTPNMDYMAQNGSIGIVTTIPEGMTPGSDVGNMSLLGYDPKRYLSGRAPLEAANMGISLDKDEVAFRCNLVTVTDEKMADYSASHISTKEAALLIESLNNDVGLDDIKFYVGKSYRHLLVLRVRNPDDYLKIKTTPPHDIMGRKFKQYLPRGKQAPMLLKLMERSRKVFEGHSVNQVRIDLGENPANMIWLWGQGIKPDLPIFKDKFGVEGGIISAVDLVNGIGKLAGLKVIEVPGITGYYDTNYAGKAKYALEALKSLGIVFIHIEAADEAGHNGDIKAKVSCIEKIDKEVIGEILSYFNECDDIRILVVPDHPTPVSLRTHTADAVGFIMFGKNIPASGISGYSEKTTRESGVVYDTGETLLNDFIKRYM